MKKYINETQRDTIDLNSLPIVLLFAVVILSLRGCLISQEVAL